MQHTLQFVMIYVSIAADTTSLESTLGSHIYTCQRMTGCMTQMIQPKDSLAMGPWYVAQSLLDWRRALLYV